MGWKEDTEREGEGEWDRSRMKERYRTEKGYRAEMGYRMKMGVLLFCADSRPY